MRFGTVLGWVLVLLLIAGPLAAQGAPDSNKSASEKPAPAAGQPAKQAEGESKPAAEPKKKPEAEANKPKAEPAKTTGSAKSAAKKGAGSQSATRSAESTPKSSTPASKPPSSAPSKEPVKAMNGATYLVRVRDLAQRIEGLKEQIRRSHTRLSLLSESILASGIGGARAEITFVNELSSAFRLVSAVVVLDGQVQYSKEDDTGALSAQKEIPIFSGSIPPGDHTLQVRIKLRGHGYGVFSYLRGYSFQSSASHSFTVTQGKSIELEAIAWEKGGITAPLEERPAVRFVQKINTTLGAEAKKAAPAPPPKARATDK